MNIRQEWLERLLKIVTPVMDALYAGKLKATMPLKFHEPRKGFAPLEAFGRSMLGFSAWLEVPEESLSEEERELQKSWKEKTAVCLKNCADPASLDFMNFTTGGQPLVDTAFLAHALVRAPKFTASLPEETKKLLADAFRSSRGQVPVKTNWILFTAMVEAGLYLLGEDYDQMRIIYAIWYFQDWYKGDGVYGDGEMYHWDYYNSFVIQPMLTDLVLLFGDVLKEAEKVKAVTIERAARYASELERMISPEGTYPVIGRSICYRFGMFQMLSQAALEHMLEEQVSPASVRCGLTAVIRKVMSSPDMFDAAGFLQPGVYGLQPELAESYINIGSLYLCSSVFLPLGLTPDDPFWTDADADWTGKKVWAGGHITIDHAID